MNPARHTALSDLAAFDALDDEQSLFDASEGVIVQSHRASDEEDEQEDGFMFRSLLERPDVLWDVWRATIHQPQRKAHRRRAPRQATAS